MLAFIDFLEIEPNTLQRFRRLVLDAEAQQGIAQQSAHEKFERQVADSAIAVSLDG